MTEDVDLTLLTGWDHEPFVKELADLLRFRPTGGLQAAIRSRVGFYQTRAGVGVDIAFGAIPFEERSVQRSSLWQTGESLTLRTCSAEDLVVHKCFANRDHDWLDVESILVRQSGRPLISGELSPLAALKPEDQIMCKWQRLANKLGHRRKGARRSRQ